MRPRLCYTPRAMLADAQPIAAVVVEPIDLNPPVESVVVSFSRAPSPAILEGTLNGHRDGRYSVFACDPIDEFTLAPGAEVCPFDSLARRTAAYPQVAAVEGGIPFTGGWIGFFTYEAGLVTERIPCSTKREVPLPAAWFRLYDTAAVYDRMTRRWYLAAVDWPTGSMQKRPSVTARLASLRDRLRAASRLALSDPPEPDASDPIPNVSREAYLAKVDRALEYIGAGDIYQVNLTQRFRVRTDASPLTLYRRLRRSNPSSHAAFLPWGRIAILSSSPELFLRLQGGHVVTRPIKGTRPRVGDSVLDAVNRRELVESAKERAELTMIIDLLRNDLGRVCSMGSVRVVQPGVIEEHPTVFHRVATIEGELAAGCTWVDLLRAAFPGGSVTGAPKIRAMQIIDELEPTARGVYCGSIGIIGLDGSVSLNIAIRTMVQIRDRVDLYSGGAIVADSTPAQEYDETIVKAMGMLRALGCGTRELRVTNYELRTERIPARRDSQTAIRVS